GAAVSRVPDQGMAEMGQMHADLVRAPGLQPALDERGERPGVAKGLEHAIARARLFAAAAQHRHALAVEGAAADLAFDAPLSRARRAPDDGVIGALDGVVGELLGEALHRALGLGGDEEAARILVEAVDDA